MATNTTQYNFQKPEVGADSDNWGDMLNGNWDATDSLLRGATALTRIGIGTTNSTLPLICNAATTADIAASFSGLVGIGTNNPTSKLHVAGDGDVASKITVERTGSTTGTNVLGYDYIGTFSDTALRLFANSTQAMAIDTSGNVELSGGDLVLRSDSDDADTQYIRFENYPSDIRTAYIRADYTSQLAGGGTALAFGTNDHQDATDTDSMVIDIEGNVGIGTTNPSRSLDVQKSTIGDVASFRGSDAARELVITSSTTTSTGDTYTLNANSGNGVIAIATGSTERMRIDSSGYVGIGTTSPSSPLHVTHNTGVKLSDSASTRHLNLTPPLADGTPAIVESTSANGLRLNASGTNAPLQLYSNNTERMRIDSSGNLLVGKTATGFGTAGIELFHDNQVYATSTTHGLAVNRLSTDGDIAKFYKDGSTVGSIGTRASFLNIGSGDTGLLFNSTSDRIQPESTSGGARDAAIDIGGSTTRFKDLHLSGNAQIGDGKNLSWGGNYSDGNPTIAASSNFIAFYPEGNVSGEAARLDSSGNVFVGKTASSLDTTGVQLQNDGLLRATKSGGDVLQLNRQSTDGVIVNFYRDGGTPIGSIGSIPGGIEVTAPTYLVLGCDDTGIRIASNEYVLPYNPSTDALNDGAVSLGAASSRFKDLYLSGGVYLGGTGAANQLHDYEEGTWTPNLYGSTSGSASPVSYGSASTQYTKVGRFVYFNAYITNVNAAGHSLTGDFRISGLPFPTSRHAPIIFAYTDLFTFDEADKPVSGYISSGSTYIAVRKGSSKTSVPVTEFQNNNTSDLMISGSYTTSS